MSQKKISGGVVHQVTSDLKKALTYDPQALTAWEDITPLARNEWICWIESAKKQKLEAAGSSGAVQALRMENDAPVVVHVSLAALPRWRRCRSSSLSSSPRRHALPHRHQPQAHRLA